MVAGCLPWYLLTIFGEQHTIFGFNLWPGRVTITLFVAAGILLLATMGSRAVPTWRPCITIAAGIAVAIFSGIYIARIEFPEPSRIEVREGGDAARAFGENLIKSMDGGLSVGAPMALVLGICLAILGICDCRCGGKSVPPPA